jgi:acyl-CoA synthetase (AMP-forming)/AMP-acid ligase II
MMAERHAAAGAEPDVATVLEAIAARDPDAECLVAGDRRLTWADVTDRTRRLANHLVAHGLGARTERAQLAPHESGQDHLAVYLRNGFEYLECMLGAFKARVAPLNVNYRYVADELHHVLADSGASAVVIHSCFAPTLSAVRADLPDLRVVIQVPDASGHELLPGAHWYEDVLAARSGERPRVCCSPDDLYVLYTGGTTGRPKGVLWRNGDALVECFGGSPTAADVAGFVADATVRFKALVTPPFMHGAGQWVAFRIWLGGGTVFVGSRPDRLDPADVWTTVDREGIDFLLIAGDAFAGPLLDELDRRSYDLTSLNVLLSGGAPLSLSHKRALLARLPTVMIVDGLGSSEAGGQLAHVSTSTRVASGRFPLRPGNHVLSASLDRELVPGDDEVGWLAKSGRLALGYLGDPIATASTFPVIGGRRYAVPGDRARLLADGEIELCGRDAATIVSGGEKIFAEEVEAALKAHPAVYDCVVVGRPSARWGDEVVAVVHRRLGRDLGAAQLLAAVSQQLARYKLPKAIVFVDAIVRSPSGKADYHWAREVAAGSARS